MSGAGRLTSVCIGTQYSSYVKCKYPGKTAGADMKGGLHPPHCTMKSTSSSHNIQSISPVRSSPVGVRISIWTRTVQIDSELSLNLSQTLTLTQNALGLNCACPCPYFHTSPRRPSCVCVAQVAPASVPYCFCTH